MPSHGSQANGQSTADRLVVGRPTPQASSALVCLMASAWQRIFELQCQTALGVILGREYEVEDDAATDVLPAYRYATGVLDICRHSSESMFGLLRAQMRGEHDHVDALAEAALHDFALTSADAAQAARTTLLTGIETVSDLAAAMAAGRVNPDPVSVASSEDGLEYPFLGAVLPRFPTIFPMSV